MEDRDALAALLIDFGADLTAVNIAGNTPLHTAASRNSKGCVQWLLKRGADRQKLNKTGQTPERIAALTGLQEIEQIIVDFKDENIELPPHRLVIQPTEKQLIINNVLQSLNGIKPYTPKSLPMSVATRTLIEKNELRRKMEQGSLNSLSMTTEKLGDSLYDISSCVSDSLPDLKQIMNNT
jgi:hypothetical protein